jgi:adenylate cyclase
MFVRQLRVSGFDAMQRVWPLVLDEPQVLIVDIDEESLRRYGQWPWPRTLMAELVDRIAAAKPGLLGIDVVFSEPDRLSPPQIPKFIPALPESVSVALAGMQSSDETLAQAIAKVPTVLAMAPSNQDVAPASGRPRPPALIVQKGDPPTPFLFKYKSMIHSLPAIAHAARAEASSGIEPDDDGILRAVPLMSIVEGDLVPAFSVELLRLAARARATVVTTGRGGITSVAIGDITMPTDARGRAYPHFQKTRADRYISAANLLDPKFDPHVLEKHIVLLGVSGVGLLDQKTIPIGQVLGTEVQVQLIESVIAGALLIRHPQALWFELALILVPGLVVIGAFRYRQPSLATAELLFALLLLAGIELGSFLFADWLLDTLYSTGVAVMLFGTMLGGQLARRGQYRAGAAQAEADCDEGGAQGRLGRCQQGTRAIGAPSRGVPGPQGHRHQGYAWRAGRLPAAVEGADRHDRHHSRRRSCSSAAAVLGSPNGLS